MPLWLESGLSAVAGGVGVRADEIRIGGPIPKYVREIHKKHQSNLDWVLRATDLSEISGGRRARFEAHAWSIAHIFYFGVGNPDGTRETFARALDLLASDSTAANGQEVIAELTSGRGERLARLASEYVKAGQYRVEVLKPPAFREESFEVRPLAQQRSLVELGFLALSLDRPKLARSHFRRAEAIDPGNARALAGLALASVNRFSKAEVLARRADAQGNDDPLVQTWLGRFYALSAAGATDESERKRRLASARSHFSRSIELDESGVMPRLAMGLTYLQPGEDVESGQAWLAAAERLRPESLDVELARARLYMRLGRDAEAKQHAQHVVSRSRSAELRKQALGILDSLKTVSR
jgi:tetratricopeptide (TPR) repeat protein